MRPEKGGLHFAALVLISLLSCAETTSAQEAMLTLPDGAVKTGSMPLSYAKQFTVDDYDNGVSMITIQGKDRYLLLPEGMEDITGVEDGITVLHQPLDTVYLAASSAMDFYRAMGHLDQVRLTSTKASDWSMPEAVSAMESEELLYAGKYSAPDYELILSEKVDVAIESTMIYHSPKTMEQLQKLGIPVMVERSSYESEPLGRMEWIKLYGLLMGCREEAEEFFDRQAARVEALDAGQTGRTVAFFSISPAGYAVVRKSTDYVAKMIAMAGGTYILPPQPGDADTALSTINMEMESFFEAARDADIIIYNSAIDADIRSINELLAKSELLSRFRAVQNGAVWCTGKNLFQQTTLIADMIVEMSHVIQRDDVSEDELRFLHLVE